MLHCSSHHRFTSSPGEKVFQIKISAPDEQFTRVGVQVLDRKDGSYIVRYRMYASYKNLKIEVKFQGQHDKDKDLRNFHTYKLFVVFVEINNYLDELPVLIYFPAGVANESQAAFMNLNY